MLVVSVVGLPLHATPDDQPPALTLVRMLTQWTWDPWLVIPLVALAGLYLWGVRILRRRGDAWSVGRTVSWCLGGIGTSLIATSSFLGAYDAVLFSVHMVQHMMLSMITPVFLAIGAPVALLLRVLHGRPRRVVAAVLHSWPAKVALWPPLPTALMCAVPFGLYLTDLYEFTLRNGWAHNVMHVFFLAMGCAFFWPLLGNDPLPHRLPYPLRMLLFLITMPFHSFLGTMIMSSPNLIAEDWYVSFLRAWPPSPQQDQFIAGGILWGAGDFIMIVVIVSLFGQWLASSRREAAREDRRLDREEAAQRRAEAGCGYDGTATTTREILHEP